MILDINILRNGETAKFHCLGCSDRLRVHTSLPWKAIDHNSWSYEENYKCDNEVVFVLISRSTCFDALAAGAAMEALCEKFNLFFSSEDVYGMTYID